MYPEIFVLQISKIRFIRSRPSQAAVIQMKPSQIAFLIHVIKSKAYGEELFDIYFGYSHRFHDLYEKLTKFRRLKDRLR